LAAVILRSVLGGLVEQKLRRALSSRGGDVGILWQSGISLGLWVAAVLLLVLPWWIPKLLAARQPSTR
jgi:putative tricarboxylic transport membrane protein